MQYWTRQKPCVNCGSSSNTGHDPLCHSAFLYDKDGKSISAVERHRIVTEIKEKKNG